MKTTNISDGRGLQSVKDQITKAFQEIRHAAVPAPHELIHPLSETKELILSATNHRHHNVAAPTHQLGAHRGAVYHIRVPRETAGELIAQAMTRKP